jgi:hypothetical protein
LVYSKKRHVEQIKEPILKRTWEKNTGKGDTTYKGCLDYIDPVSSDDFFSPYSSDGVYKTWFSTMSFRCFLVKRRKTNRGFELDLGILQNDRASPDPSTL